MDCNFPDLPDFQFRSSINDKLMANPENDSP